MSHCFPIPNCEARTPVIAFPRAQRLMSAALLAVAVLFMTGTMVWAAPVVGQPAPDFKGTDTTGHVQSLDQYRGKVVILEWTNHECPFVRKEYSGGAMQALQKDATGQGVVWLSIISSAPNEQGYVDAAEAEWLTRERGASPSAVILDPSGTIGRTYDAKTTPHMFVIDKTGTLVYQGAIDDQPNTTGDPRLARNYVRDALQEMAAGKPIETPVTKSYGCSVKYGS